MSRADVERLLADGDAGGELPCVRVARGADGRVLTREDFAARPVTATRRGWLRRVASIAATFGVGSLFHLGCDTRVDEPVFATGGITPTTMPANPVIGDIVPMGKPAPPTTSPADMPNETTLGEAAIVPAEPQKPTTRPTTVPANGPNNSGHTMGVIAPQ